jgi:hypothetical protein
MDQSRSSSWRYKETQFSNQPRKANNGINLNQTLTHRCQTYNQNTCINNKIKSTQRHPTELHQMRKVTELRPLLNAHLIRQHLLSLLSLPLRPMLRSQTISVFNTDKLVLSLTRNLSLCMLVMCRFCLGLENDLFLATLGFC